MPTSPRSNPRHVLCRRRTTGGGRPLMVGDARLEFRTKHLFASPICFPRGDRGVVSAHPTPSRGGYALGSLAGSTLWNPQPRWPTTQLMRA